MTTGRSGSFDFNELGASDMKCEHCGRLIHNFKKAWSRSRLHWCSKSCFDQDNHANQVEQRKKSVKSS